MAIKSPDKLIPAGAFKLADLSDIDISVKTNVTSTGYDPGAPAAQTGGDKYLITVAPGFQGGSLHANFNNNLSIHAQNNIGINDILEWDNIAQKFNLR